VAYDSIFQILYALAFVLSSRGPSILGQSCLLTYGFQKSRVSLQG